MDGAELSCRVSCMGIAAAASISMIVIGSLCISGGISPFSGGWTIFGLSIGGAGGGLVVPVLGILGAYNVVSPAVMGGVAIAVGSLQTIVFTCISSCATYALVSSPDT